jgi:hypothetical protein
MKPFAIVAVFFALLSIPAAAFAADRVDGDQTRITHSGTQAPGDGGALLARSPGGCRSEQCCHQRMQDCFDAGGGPACSDAYERCVDRLSD